VASFLFYDIVRYFKYP